MRVAVAIFVIALASLGRGAPPAQAPRPRPNLGALPPAVEGIPGSPARAVAIPITRFLNVLSENEDTAAGALDEIDENWNASHTIPLLELATVAEEPELRAELHELVTARTGQRLLLSPAGPDTAPIYAWAWRENVGLPANYAEFKAELYATVDPGFRELFFRGMPAKVRLDEILWSGVEPDEVPALKDPRLLSVNQATYLQPANAVFGIQLNSEARAYPMRIVAWHEIVLDTLGGERILLAYCPLSGAMSAYRVTANKVTYDFEPSGFLYRSTKLITDTDTHSLWSVMSGRPVAGRLASQDLEMDALPVVTTTWAEWRKRHPKTQVLSLDTGHTRNYAEGAAHAAYFANDAVMFPVPLTDRRLPNKSIVLGLTSREAPGESIALPVAFLVKNPIYHGKFGPVEFVVLTDASGASRVYETDGQRFVSWDKQSAVVDTGRKTWGVTETGMVAANAAPLPRLPVRRTFWFAWFAHHPNTRLVK